MKRTRIIGLGTVLLGVVFATPAWAYRVLEHDGVPVGWRASTVVFDIEQNVPNEVNFDQVLEQVQLAADILNAEKNCGAPKIQITFVRAGAGASGDGRNTIQWVHSDWAGTGQTDEATGYTDILIETTDSSSKILETDIWLNGENFDWTSDATVVPQLMNIAGTVAHEFGHALGLDHPCELDATNDIPVCSDDTTDVTLMYPMVLTSEPELTNDDVAGLCSIYQETECKEDGAGCSSSSNPTSPETVVDCSNDAECDTNEYCRSGVCVKMPGLVGDVCEENADCVTSVCFKGACREACNSDLRCASGLECDEKTLACGTGTLAFGDSCKTAENCVTGLCYIAQGPESYCTRNCDASSPCPDGYACEGSEGDRSFCVIPVENASGCTVSGKNSGSTLWGLISLGLLIVGRKLRTVRTGK